MIETFQQTFGYLLRSEIPQALSTLMLCAATPVS